MRIPEEIIQLLLLFYLLRIEHEMIFDKDKIGSTIELLSDCKIKFVGSHRPDPYYAARLRYGISLDKSQYLNLKFISWKISFVTQVSHFWQNCMPFIGVVSNRTTDFDTSPFKSSRNLIDAYGIGASQHSVYNQTKKLEDDNRGSKIVDLSYSGMQKGNLVHVKYMIHESKLIFENLKEGASYQLSLPTDIDGITEWYPAVCLRFQGDVCEISDIIVE